MAKNDSNIEKKGNRQVFSSYPSLRMRKREKKMKKMWALVLDVWMVSLNMMAVAEEGGQNLLN